MRYEKINLGRIRWEEAPQVVRAWFMRGRLQCYMWGWMVVIGHMSSKRTFGANNVSKCCERLISNKTYKPSPQ